MAITINAGSPLLIEVEFTKADPFKGYQLFDPNSTVYKVIAPDNVTIKDTGSLLLHDIGRWYCVVQTETTWDLGDYTVCITSIYDTTSDVEVKKTAFTLSAACAA